MALDAIFEVVVRFVVNVVFEILFVGVFYWPGWLVLRIVTVGRYPPAGSVPHNKELVAVVGFAAFLVAITLAYMET